VEQLKVVYRAPAGCPPQEAFVAEVASRTSKAKLGDDLGATARSRTIDVRIAARGGQYFGRVSLLDIGNKGKPRELVGRTCTEVVSALALVTALAIDPRANTGNLTADAGLGPIDATLGDVIQADAFSSDAGLAQADAFASVDAAAAEAQAPATMPDAGGAAQAPLISPETPAAVDERPVAGPEEDRALRFSLGLGARVHFVLGPVAGGELQLRARTGLASVTGFEFRVGFGRTFSYRQTVDAAGADFRWTMGSATGCRRWTRHPRFYLLSCLQGQFGVVQSTPFGLRSNGATERGYGALAVSANLGLELGPYLSLELDLAAHAPLVRDQFLIGTSEQVYRIPPVFPTFGLTLWGNLP
jgi:hypothetical protein